MRPDEILRARLDLYGKANGSGLFPRVIRSILSENVDELNGGVTEPAVVERLYGAFAAHLQAAYSYRVTESMTDLLIAAADGLDETDVFDRDLAPTGCGMVRFDKPLPMTDVRGRTMLIHWMSWGPCEVDEAVTRALSGDVHRVSKPGTPAMAFWFFNDIYTQPDSYSQRALDEEPALVIEAVGRWSFIGAQVAENGEVIGAPLVTLNDHTIQKVISEGDDAHMPTNSLRYIHALWLLLNQTIVQTEVEATGKHARKSMKRMRMPESVTVIRLRRTEASSAPGESMVEWTHRWIVRGHWAWRHCGPDHPQARPYKDGWGVRLFITPYVKGPEGLPLVVTSKLYDLSR